MSKEGRIIFNRPPRIQKALPKDHIDLPTPPEAQFKGGAMEWFTLILPLLMSGLSMGAIAVVSLFSRGSNPLFFLSTGVMALGFVILGTINLVDRRVRDRRKRQDFAKLIDRREEELRDYARQQQTILHYLYPAPEQILGWVHNQDLRLWERRIADQDFSHVRIGIGSRPNSVEVNLNRQERQDDMVQRVTALAEQYQEIPNVPDLVELNQIAFLGVVGAPRRTAAFVSAMMCQLAAHHSPDEIKIVATYPPERSQEWEWLGWLPHTRLEDGAGNEVPMVACHSDQVGMVTTWVLDTLKSRENRKNVDKVGNSSGVEATMGSAGDNGPRKTPYQFPYVVWVIDDFRLVQDEPAIKKAFEVGYTFGVFLIITAKVLADVPDQCLALIEMLSNGQVRYGISGEGGRVTTVQPDLASYEFRQEFGQAMAPLKPKPLSEAGDLPNSLRLLEIMGVRPEQGETIDPLQLWNNSPTGLLKVPVGRVFGGQELYLDLSDKGHGPHGLIAGTTGSGKSELLLTIVSTLALYNHPDNLNFILGDFKGGATFNPFINLPHVVGMMSDLDLTIVERAMTAIFSELKRRERLLKEEGVTHIREYQKKKPKPKTPMPYLIMIIDEFAEMKEQAPDFMEKIGNIARTGRTLGVHLLLATQRPAGVVTGQLNSNTKFRLCLRVETVDDSVDMLSRKDAFMIPSNMPGRCFFKVGSDIFEQFQVARVAVPFSNSPEESVEVDVPVAGVVDTAWRFQPLLPPPVVMKADKNDDEDEDNTPYLDHDEITEQCILAAKRTVIRNKHKPWLDPMQKEYFLPDFMEDRGFDEQDLKWPAQPPYGQGQTPIALLDNVVDQVQVPFYANLPLHGSYCISGLAVSGKTNLIRTLLTSLALSHSPDDISFFVFDMGNTLKPFSNLPHETTYVAITEQGKLKGVMKQLFDELQRRKTALAQRGVLDLASYRRLPNIEKMPLIFIAFDNYASIRHSPPFDMELLKAIVREGRPYGMHLAITMDRANDFEYGRMADQFFQIVLRQNRDDILFSIPKNMLGSWNGTPGRGFIQGGHNRPPMELQILLPRQASQADQSKELDNLFAAMQRAVAKHPAWSQLNNGQATAAANAAEAAKADAMFAPPPSQPAASVPATPPPSAPAPASKAPARPAPVANDEPVGSGATSSEDSQSYWSSLFPPVEAVQADVGAAAPVSNGWTGPATAENQPPNEDDEPLGSGATDGEDAQSYWSSLFPPIEATNVADQPSEAVTMSVSVPRPSLTSQAEEDDTIGSGASDGAEAQSYWSSLFPPIEATNVSTSATDAATQSTSTPSLTRPADEDDEQIGSGTFSSEDAQSYWSSLFPPIEAVQATPATPSTNGQPTPPSPAEASEQPAATRPADEQAYWASLFKPVETRQFSQSEVEGPRRLNQSRPASTEPEFEPAQEAPQADSSSDPASYWSSLFPPIQARQATPEEQEQAQNSPLSAARALNSFNQATDDNLASGANLAPLPQAGQPTSNGTSDGTSSNQEEYATQADAPVLPFPRPIRPQPAEDYAAFAQTAPVPDPTPRPPRRPTDDGAFAADSSGDPDDQPDDQHERRQHSRRQFRL